MKYIHICERAGRGSPELSAAKFRFYWQDTGSVSREFFDGALKEENFLVWGRGLIHGSGRALHCSAALLGAKCSLRPRLPSQHKPLPLVDGVLSRNICC